MMGEKTMPETSLLRDGIDFLYGCPIFSDTFKNIDDYLAYSEGEYDFVFVDPMCKSDRFDNWDDYVAWYLNEGDEGDEEWYLGGECEEIEVYEELEEYEEIEPHRQFQFLSEFEEVLPDDIFSRLEQGDFLALEEIADPGLRNLATHAMRQLDAIEVFAA
ncbi:hypothetical protein ACX27_07915 [Nostoc piscinale CENA21]|uniref:Uncharacterized protein n=2 Tax=Nostoc TaxID=1177 RepID=A0A0M4T2S1_9NOSO|nr:hypothetical protein ACX27_07915 [Nostoc piscinale CENA21]